MYPSSNPCVAKGPRACATCARAKSRCIPGPIPDKCERCHRLNKQCGTQTPAPPRRRKEPKRTKVQQLEQRLEDLTARLESVTSSKSPTGRDPHISGPGFPWKPQNYMMAHLFPRGVLAGNPEPLPMPPEKSPGGPAPSTAESTPESFRVARPEEPSDTSTPDVGSTPTTTTATDRQKSPPPLEPVFPPLPAVGATAKLPFCSTERSSEESVWPRRAEAEEYLSSYRRDAADLLPFVLVPEHMSSAQLFKERPCLWKGIMIQAFYVDGQRQQDAGLSLVQGLTKASFCQAAKSIDMLQGLMVMIAWFHYNLNSVQVTNLFFLARGMVATLNLCEKVAQLTQRPSPELTALDLEETRTLAGVYYLLTMVFNTNKKPDCLMDSSHAENCCKVLESRLDAPGDLLAINLCRIQMLSHSIATGVADTNRQAHQPPFYILIKSFRQRINSLRAELPPAIANNPQLNCHIHTAEILLNEPAMNESPSQYFAPSDRIPLLWQTLQAAKGFLGVRTSIPFFENQRFTCMSSFDYMYVFITCLKLVLLDVAGWDILMVKQELNLEPVIDRKIREMEALSRRRFLGVGGEAADKQKQWDLTPEMKQRDPFHRLSVKLRQLKFLFHFDPPEPVLPRSPDVSTAPANVDPEMNDFDVDMNLGFGFDGSDMGVPPLDGGFDPEYWHDVFSDSTLKFYSGHMHTQDVPYVDSSFLDNDIEPPSLALGSVENRWPV